MQAVFGANRLHVLIQGGGILRPTVGGCIQRKDRKLRRGLGFVVEQTAQLAGGLPVGIGRQNGQINQAVIKAARQRSLGPVEGLSSGETACGGGFVVKAVLTVVLVSQQQTGGILPLLLSEEYGADDFPLRQCLPAAA